MPHMGRPDPLPKWGALTAADLRARAGRRLGGGRWLVPPWTAPALLGCAVVLIPWTALAVCDPAAALRRQSLGGRLGRVRYRARRSARLHRGDGGSALAVRGSDRHD